MNRTAYSYLLDLFQVASILLILITGPLCTFDIVPAIFQILALVIMALAAYEMRRTKYYRVPDIGKQNELVKTGIYRYIRNPMYLSELLFAAVLVIHAFNLFRLTVLVVLFITFILKIQYEEHLLYMHFKSKFAAWKKTSWRLLPFIY